MGPIFNEKVAKKCNLWVREQYTEILFTEDLVNNYGLEKKKNAERKNVDAQSKHSLYVMWELKKHTTKMYQPKVEVLKHKKLLI